ncbi:MAG: formyltransferase family protein [Spirochaetes bacterium]|jgi:methionyl-tRNA formyltransferase|nr:formyltransferase family protein [Spirochaetota bacterium]
MIELFNWKNFRGTKIDIGKLYDNLVNGTNGNNALRIIVYAGLDRPRGRVDYGLQLIERLDAYKHHVTGIIIENNDPMAIYPEVTYKQQIIYPQFMCDKIAEVKKNISSSSYAAQYEDLQEQIRNLKPDLGVVFLGRWVPPEIFNIPRLGFINYHPGPLPYLRGMEPDTFAILEGWNSIWGTVHKINEGFDTGDILFTTPKIEINEYATPVSVLHDLTQAGIELIHETVHAISKDKDIPRQQLEGSGSMATFKMAMANSYIEWEHDSNQILNRKLRAFCGQDIGVRLKLRLGDDCYTVLDLELYEGSFPGKSGDLLGYYAGRGRFLLQPIYRTIDGVAILLTGKKIDNPGTAPESRYLQEWIIPPRKRENSTNLKNILKSIALFNSPTKN